MYMTMAQRRKEDEFLAAYEDHERSMCKLTSYWKALDDAKKDIKELHRRKDASHHKIIDVRREASKELRRIHSRINPLRKKRDNLINQINSTTDREVKAQLETQLANTRSRIKELNKKISECHLRKRPAEEDFKQYGPALDAAHTIKAKQLKLYNRARYIHQLNKEKLWKASAARVTAEERTRVLKIAEIPPKFKGGAKVLKNIDNQFDIYYGGIDKPDGDKHGHAVVEPDGVVSYHRKPGGIHKPEEDFTSDKARREFQESRTGKGESNQLHQKYSRKTTTHVDGYVTS